MFFELLQTDPRTFAVVVITVMFSICLHELAHGWVAIWYGDRTPIETGHMTFNPLVHMGWMSMLLLAVAGIAWGLMPVNPSRMRGRYAAAVVALAGPAMNALLAVLAIAALGLWERMDHGTVEPSLLVANLRFFLWVLGTINITLLLFNLIPVPPLDGSRVLAEVSPGYASFLDRTMRNGTLGIAFLVLFFFGSTYLEQVSVSTATHMLTWITG